MSSLSVPQSIDCGLNTGLALTSTWSTWREKETPVEEPRAILTFIVDKNKSTAENRDIL